jgi:hypothetical protein
VTPIFQKLDSWNCFQCSLASILDLPLEQVPHFFGSHFASEDTSVIWRGIHAWLAERGIALIAFDPKQEDALSWPHLVCGQSPRGDWGHCVIRSNGKLLHDPHPSGEGLKDIWEVFILCPLNPADLVKRASDKTNTNHFEVGQSNG